jgi:hypothetical protein
MLSSDLRHMCISQETLENVQKTSFFPAIFPEPPMPHGNFADVYTQRTQRTHRVVKQAPVPPLGTCYGGPFSPRWPAADETLDTDADRQATLAKRYAVGRTAEEYTELMAKAEAIAAATIAAFEVKERAEREQKEAWARQAELSQALERRYAGGDAPVEEDEDSDILDYWPGSDPEDTLTPAPEDAA